MTSLGTSIKQAIKILSLLLLIGIVISAVAFWAPDLSKRELKLEYANQASRFITLDNGQEVHYRDRGSSEGNVFVFIHGTSASLHTWEPLIETLGSNVRLISLDLPGHGLSGANFQRDYSLTAMATAVLKLIDYLDIDSATLVGNSLGGAVAWKAAIERPDVVRSLILLSPSGAPKTSPSKSNIGFKILQTSIGQSLMTRITPRFLIETSLHQSVSKQNVVDDEMVNRYWRLLRLKGNRQAMIDLANTPRDLNQWKQFRSIEAPVLLIWGIEDNLLPVSMSETFESEMRDVTSVKLEGIGHLPMEEDAQAVSNLIQNFCQTKRC